MNNFSSNKISILIADDHPLTRTGICTAISRFPDMEVVGEASNGIDAQYMVSTLHPRLILLDLNMPELPPAMFVKWVREYYPDTSILVLTFHINNPSFLAGMMDAGVAGYLSKTISAEELVTSIRHVANGNLVFDNQQMIVAYQWRKEVCEKIKRLTHQEVEVIKLLMSGKNNQTIADTLNISLKTVTYHLTSLFSKLQVQSRLEATLWAMDNLLDNLDMFPYMNQDNHPG